MSGFSQVSNFSFDTYSTQLPFKVTYPHRANTMLCGLINTIWYETYDLWDALLLGLGGLLVKLGL